MKLVATNSGIDTDAAAAAVPANVLSQNHQRSRGEVKRGDFGGWKQSSGTNGTSSSKPLN
jgi:hypothetical protein